MPSISDINRQIRAAQRQAEQQMKRQVADHNRKVDAHNKRVVTDYNRRVDAHNRKVDSDRRRAVDQYNRRAETHNRRLIADLNRQRSAASRPPVRFSDQDEVLVERVHQALPVDKRDYDVFVSYAKIDGAQIATELDEALRNLGVATWFDELAIRPGRSQSLQMDQGLRKAKAGVVVLTPAYLAGRFWTERELGALLHKSIVIPVLHEATFDDVREYSGILPDLAGFETAHDTIADIAAKIAAAVLSDEDGVSVTST